MAAVGCFQELNTDAATEVPVASGDSTAKGNANGQPLPAPFTGGDINSASTTQCTYGSALCYELCGSPSCAMQDNTIPGEVQDVPNVLPDGGTVAENDPCAVVEAQSMLIRQRSCAMCHGPPPAPAPQFNWILDDSKLVSQNAPILNAPLVVAGQPAASPIMQRIQQGISGGQLGMPPNSGVAGGYLSDPSIIQYPTAEDYSVLESWILNCVQNADGGAYSNSYYGGNYAPPSLYTDGGAPPAPAQGSSSGGGGGGGAAATDAGMGGGG